MAAIFYLARAPLRLLACPARAGLSRTSHRLQVALVADLGMWQNLRVHRVTVNCSAIDDFCLQLLEC